MVYEIGIGRKIIKLPTFKSILTKTVCCHQHRVFLCSEVDINYIEPLSCMQCRV